MNFVATEIHKRLRCSWCNVFGPFMLLKTSFALLLRDFFSWAQIYNLFCLFFLNMLWLPKDISNVSFFQMWNNSMEMNSEFYYWKSWEPWKWKVENKTSACFFHLNSVICHTIRKSWIQSWNKDSLRNTGLLAYFQVYLHKSSSNPFI